MEWISKGGERLWVWKMQLFPKNQYHAKRVPSQRCSFVEGVLLLQHLVSPLLWMSAMWRAPRQTCITHFCEQDLCHLFSTSKLVSGIGAQEPRTRFQLKMMATRIIVSKHHKTTLELSNSDLFNGLLYLTYFLYFWSSGTPKVDPTLPSHMFAATIDLVPDMQPPWQPRLCRVAVSKANIPMPILTLSKTKLCSCSPLSLYGKWAHYAMWSPLPTNYNLRVWKNNQYLQGY